MLLRHSIPFVLFPLLLALQSCVGIGSVQIGNSQASELGTELARSADERGNRESWRLFPGDSVQDPRLELSRTTIREIPRVGVTVSSITPKLAASLGRADCIVVRSASSQLPAGSAGLRRGDLILAINGEPVSETSQFSDRVASAVEDNPEAPIELQVLFRNRSDLDDNGERVLRVKPTFVESEESAVESFPLERSEGLFAYTGLEVVTLSPDYARSIYGTQSPVFVISGVVTGSPAYHAGLRAGDRLLSVLGEPIDSLQPLNDAVLELVRREDPTAPPLDLLDSSFGSFALVLPEDVDTIQLEVDGPLGPHATELGVILDLEAESEITVPILFNYEESLTEHESGFLNFIFTFGYDYEHRTYASATRAPREASSLSLLPLSLIQRERRPGKTEWRVLWIISWDA